MRGVGWVLGLWSLCFVLCAWTKYQVQSSKTNPPKQSGDAFEASPDWQVVLLLFIRRPVPCAGAELFCIPDKVIRRLLCQPLELSSLAAQSRAEQSGLNGSHRPRL